MSERALYLRAAESLRRNPGQWAAYDSHGHCVVLAGPGSGKTRTLTVKLARLLAEDVQEPRGVACITYNNECARELESRLAALGIEPGGRVFIGTVHSFSLTQIVLPYAKVAGLGLPDEFSVATQSERARALERAYRRVIGGPDNPQRWDFRMGNYRRAFLNRSSAQWRERDPELALLVEAFEDELRVMGLIDFDDMPLLAVQALRANEWLQRALLAKYPVLVVDEYQDLGRALHRMVLELCFGAGMRLFAVGDPDQSIYGFTGARPDLLQQLSQRDDVETVHLRLNYRCGSRIVTASHYALGEDRNYEAAEGADEGAIHFHPRTGSRHHQADNLCSSLLPEIRERMPDLRLADIAILYPSAVIGDALASAAQNHGLAVIRTDGNSLYPRSSRLMRWLEQCAEWCCEGWRTGAPQLSTLMNDGLRIFSEALTTDDKVLSFQRRLLKVLWEGRDSTALLHPWLAEVRRGSIADHLERCRTMKDERETLAAFIRRTEPDGDCAEMTLGQFAGRGEGKNYIRLSTLHSAKGREFEVVIMFGMNDGVIPWHNQSEKRLLEWRRLFYVGFTRAKKELHLMYTANMPSPFVKEVEERLNANG